MSLRVFPSAAIRTSTAIVSVVTFTVLSLSLAEHPAHAAGVRLQATSSPPVPTVSVVPVVPAGDATTNVPVVPVAPDPSAVAVAESVASTPAVTTPGPTTTTIPKNRVLVLKGRGFGHGRGLGQWGAFGYARDFGWSYRKILDHYYGETMAGQVSPKSAIGVRLSSLDGKVLAVYQPKGRLFTAPEGQDGFTMPPGLAGAQPATVLDLNAPVPAVGAPIPVVGQTVPTPTPSATPNPAMVATPPVLTAAPAAIKIELVKGGFRVSDGPTCAGPWSVRPGLLNTQAVTLTAGPSDPSASADDPETMLQICSGKQRRVYRGDLLAVDARPGQRSVNIVGLDAYLRGVVPREIAASWSDKAHEAVKSQAVAARSYAAAEKRSGFSNTCDTISCQVYSGRGVYEGTKFVSYEDPRTDRAIAETANEVRVHPKTGAPIRTEFSASTGGHTAPGDFPPVEDKGDSTAANPNSSWTVRLAATRFETKNLGALIGAKVVKRDGFGADGGRVLTLQLNYTGGSRTVTGTDMMGAYGLRSSWFDAQVVAEGSETPIETLDSSSALTGDAGAAVSAAVTVAPTDTRAAAPNAAAKKSTRRPKANPATTTVVVVAVGGGPINTVAGGSAGGAPTTAAKTTKRRK